MRLRVIGLLALLSALVLAAVVWAETASLTIQHDCQDAPAPPGSGQAVSGFAGFRVYQAPAEAGPYGAATDTIDGCTKAFDVLMRYLPTSWFRVTARDQANNESPPTAAHAKTVALPTFPVTLQTAGSVEERTVSVSLTKPTLATSATLTLTAFDADNADEGKLYVNGHGPLILWGTQGVRANDNVVATLTYPLDPAWVVDGANSLRFVHDNLNSSGYRVEGVSVTFTMPTPPPDTTPPATPGLTVASIERASDGTVVALEIRARKLDCPQNVDTLAKNTTGEYVRVVRCKPMVR